MFGTAIAGARQLSLMGALPYFAGFAAVALMAGMGLGFYGGHRWQAGKVAEAKADLATLRADIRSAAAQSKADAAQLQLEANMKLQAHQDAITAAVHAIPSKVAKQLAGDLTTLRESLNAPIYDCLRYPLPESAIWVLRRPGSAVSDSGDSRTSEAASDLF